MKSKNVVIILAITALFVLSACSNTQYDALTQCLTDNDVKMFGAFWCGACNAQKKMLGDSFDNVNYIECSLPDGQSQTEYCQSEGIQSYPTWEFADGSRMNGALTPEVLAEKSGCPI